MARRYKFRPRAAWRTAWGWTLPEAAGRYNALRGRGQAEPVTALTGSRLSEWENWPFSARRPPVTGLCLLAEMYQCGVLDLVDVSDREKLPADELLALGKTSTPPHPRHEDTDPQGDLQSPVVPAGRAAAAAVTSLDATVLRQVQRHARSSGSSPMIAGSTPVPPNPSRSHLASLPDLHPVRWQRTHRSCGGHPPGRLPGSGSRSAQPLMTFPPGNGRSGRRYGLAYPGLPARPAPVRRVPEYPWAPARPAAMACRHPRSQQRRPCPAMLPLTVHLVLKERAYRNHAR